jgi:hypothetical protein
MEPTEVLASLDSALGTDELLDHLSASRAARANAIQRFWSAPTDRHVAESLIELEVDDEARNVVVHLLRERNTQPL